MKFQRRRGSKARGFSVVVAMAIGIVGIRRYGVSCGKVENRGIYHGKSKIFVDYGRTSGPRASNVLPTKGEQRFVSTFLR
jgi:hypothetical protein